MSNTWQYNTLKIASRLVCLLPYSLLLTVGKLLGMVYYHVAARQRERALAQIQESFTISRPEAEIIIKSLFTKIGQTFFEVMYMPSLTPEKIEQYIQLENKHYLSEALAEGKGVAVLAAHIGNWEWLGAALAMSGFPVASIVKRQPNEQYTKILNEYREMVGIEIFTRGTTELVAAVKALKKGRVLAFFSDQDAGDKGIFVNFLGKMASSPGGLALFSRKLGVPVIPIFMVRRPEGGHRAIISPPIHFEPTENEAEDLYRFTKETTQIIEDMIRQYPDEWLWFQKRWNTQKVGEQA